MSHNTESIFRAHIDAERADENLIRYQHVAGARASLARRRTENQWRKFERSKFAARAALKAATFVQRYGIKAQREHAEQLEREAELARSYGYPAKSARAARPEPLQPYHLTGYGATQEQAERLLRDQSEDRPAPRYFVVGYEHPTKGTRYYVQNQHRQRVSINAGVERATAWAVKFEDEHPRFADLVDENNAEVEGTRV